MYDRAPNSFKRLSLRGMHDLFSSHEFICLETQSSKSSTIITELIDDQVVQYRAHRPAVLVTSTSFTEDEDLGILLEAVQLYDADLTPDTPDLVIFITGKGPLQEFYIKQVNTLKLKRVKIKMMWLKIEDYPKLLGIFYLLLQ
jgi:beta-1,4-mannosyltransferase